VARIALLGSYAEERTFNLMHELDTHLVPGEEIEVDISNVPFMEVGPITLLLGVVLTWQQEGHSVCFSEGSSNSDCFRYLQRMNFFDSCGISYPENFVRHPPDRRFVDFQIINRHESGLAESIGETVADCLASGEDVTDFQFTDQPPEEGGFYSSLVYSVSELVKNVQQHSMGTGHIIAQEYPSKDRVKVAIVDTGIGIWESFRASGSPHSSKISSDADAIKVALDFQVSSKTHIPDPFSREEVHENAGVGLTFLKGLAEETGGVCRIISNKGGYDGKRAYEYSCGINGTFLSFSFSRRALDNFSDLLETTKQYQYKKAGFSETSFDWEGFFDE